MLTLNRITTQDVLLKEHNVERFVEIGPADVLTSMLKNTVARHLKSQDAARNITRRFLSYAQNAQEIQYLLEAGTVATPEKTKKIETPTKSTVTEAATTAQVTVKGLQTAESSEAQQNVTAPTQIANAAPIPDAQIDAKEILVAIVAGKLRKSHGELATMKTIKALANGM